MEGSGGESESRGERKKRKKGERRGVESKNPGQGLGG